MIIKNELLNDFEWGARKTPVSFNVGPMEDMHPFGYEAEIINVFEHFVEPGDVAIDAGASIGFHTCLLSKLVGEDGVVMAFEPQLISFQHLMHHVHVTNKLNNVACFRQALWNEDTERMPLFNATDMGYSTFHQYFSSVNYELVDCRKLDTLLIDGSYHPRLIKIDCEGSEAEILLGAQRLLTRGIDCVILEFNYQLLERTHRTDSSVRSMMKSLGYDMFLINIGSGQQDNMGFTDPILVEPEQKIKLDNGFHINVLFSTEEKVRARWSSKTNGKLRSFTT